MFYKSLLITGVMFAISQSTVVLAQSNTGLDGTPLAGVVLLEGDILSQPRMTQRGRGVHQSKAIWKDGIVPFFIDHELETYQERLVRSAINTWNSVAGITLVEIDPRLADAPKDYLHFVPATGCASWVGRQGGAQSIWTGTGCSKGSMMHEIGHALGLEHEHTRPDRDQYISINWDNIDAEKMDNFGVTNEARHNYGPYDYASIMHYGEYFFSANSKQTIKPLLNDGVEIGQRIAPSAGDIQSISMLYASDISLVSNVVTDSGNSEVSLLVSNEHFRGANMLELSMQIGTAQLLYNNSPGWNCVTEIGTLNCSRDRLSGAEQSAIVLGFDQALKKSDLNLSLHSKTPDGNMANNGGGQRPLSANNAAHAEPLSDQPLQANAGAMGYSLGGFGLVLSLRLMRRRQVRS